MGVGFAGDSPHDPPLEEACPGEYLDLDGTVVVGDLHGRCAEVSIGECERPAAPHGSGGYIPGGRPRHEASFLSNIWTGGTDVVVLYM